MPIPLGILATSAAAPPISVEYLLIAGGGGASTDTSTSAARSGGGAGGYRSSVSGESSGGGSPAESPATILLGTQYSVTIGAGGALGSSGSNSIFGELQSTGGGAGVSSGNGYSNNGVSGGSGSGAAATTDNVDRTGGTPTTNQGYRGGDADGRGANTVRFGAGGGGAGGQGQDLTPSSSIYATSNGGPGISSSITGTAITRAGGGRGMTYNMDTTRQCGQNGAGADQAGGGGGGADRSGNFTFTPPAQPGQAGILILRYPNTYTITLGAGLTGTTSTVGANKVTEITAGTGNVSWAA